MEAATIPEEQKERELVLFVSADPNLRIVRDPKVNRLDPNTGDIYQSPGTVYEFGNGTLAVDKENTDAIEFLRDHPQFGLLFRERGEADGPEANVLDKILDATLDRDVEKLSAIYVAERSGESRSHVLQAAAKAIEKLDGDVPQPPETPAHELERFRDPVIAQTPGFVPAPSDQVRENGGELREQTEAEAERSAEQAEPPVPQGQGIGAPIPPSTPSEPPADAAPAADPEAEAVEPEAESK